MPRTPSEQRPNINQRDSAGWSWPRLRPIKEQESRVSIKRNSAARSSQAASVHEDTEQNPSPTDMAEKRPADLKLSHLPPTSAADSAPATETPAATTENPADVRLPQSPKANAADSAPTTNISATAEEADHPSLDEAGGRVSPISDTNAQPLDAGNGRLSQAAAKKSAKYMSDVVDEPQAESSSSPGTKSDGLNPQPSALEHSRTTQPKSDDSGNKKVDAVAGPEANASNRRETVSSGTQLRRLSTQDDVTQHFGGNNPIEAKWIATSQPDMGSITRRGTNTSRDAPRDGQGAVDELQNDKVSVTFEDEVGNTSLSDDKPNTPTTTPIPPTLDRVSVPNNPVPYYATPKIMIHSPSQSSHGDASGSRTIDEVLAKERGVISPSEIPLPATKKSPESPVPSVMPRSIDTPTGMGVHRIVRVRRRSLFVRKARNAAARKTILKMTLGRQLATPTKEALRQLANGETLIEEVPCTPSP